MKGMRIVDLSGEIYADMPVYEGDPPVEVEVVHRYQDQGWELRRLVMGSHAGTHMDAFSHMHEGMENLGQISLYQMIHKAQVVRQRVELPKNVGLIFQDTLESYTIEEIADANPPFVGGKMSVEMEKAFLEHRIVTYTGLVNLEKLSEEQFLFVGLPLKIRGGDGSPVRAVALFFDEGDLNENT